MPNGGRFSPWAAGLHVPSLKGVDGVGLSRGALGVMKGRDLLAVVGSEGILGVRRGWEGVRHLASWERPGVAHWVWLGAF